MLGELALPIFFAYTVFRGMFHVKRRVVMAILQVVSVFDSAMQAHGRPLFVPALGIAVRGFTDEVNRDASDNAMHVHPEDFELVHLADFDEETGTFSQVPRRVLLRGKEVNSVKEV